MGNFDSAIFSLCFAFTPPSVDYSVLLSVQDRARIAIFHHGEPPALAAAVAMHAFEES